MKALQPSHGLGARPSTSRTTWSSPISAELRRPPDACRPPPPATAAPPNPTQKSTAQGPEWPHPPPVLLLCTGPREDPARLAQHSRGRRAGHQRPDRAGPGRSVDEIRTASGPGPEPGPRPGLPDPTNSGEVRYRLPGRSREGSKARRASAVTAKAAAAREEIGTKRPPVRRERSARARKRTRSPLRLR